MRTPSLRLDFHLVEHGYQMDVFINGNLSYGQVRDFAGNHNVGRLVTDLLDLLYRAVNTFRLGKALMVGHKVRLVDDDGKIISGVLEVESINKDSNSVIAGGHYAKIRNLVFAEAKDK